MSTETATLDTLREQHEQLKIRAEMASLEQVLRQADLESHRLVEQEWGDVVDRREYLYDTPGFSAGGGRDYRISRPDDRARGICRPFFENELDLANIRGIGRFLGTAMDTGVGILENLANYTIGSGFTYEVQPLKGVDCQAGLIATVQSMVDAFTPQLNEREAFIRSRRDGDWYDWVHEFSGEPVADVIEPEFVTEPKNVRAVEDYCGEYGLDWSFGIASLPNRPSRTVAYFVSWYGSPSDWDVVPASEMVHVKVNTDTGVKCGISDFYSVYLTLERAAKLLGNTLQGSAIQASIAYIREHVQGTTSDQITSFGNSKADRIGSLPRSNGAPKQYRQERFFPGRVIDTAGTKYHAGPLGSNNAPVYIQAIQAAFRVAGSRWAMPEYMISGDASNGNYASTLTAGGPFDRATQARQQTCVMHFTEAHWAALAVHCRLGRLARFGIHTLTELKQAIRLHVTPPTVALQDPEKAESIRDKQQAAGILSPRTRANQSGLDYDAELTNGAKPKEDIAFPVGLAPQPPYPISPSTKAGGQSGASDVHSSGEKPLENKALPDSPPDPATSLNGAQITAAKDLLADLIAGKTTAEITLGLLIAVGLPEAVARDMVKSAKQATPPEKPADPDPKQAALTAALESVRTPEEAKAILRESYP